MATTQQTPPVLTALDRHRDDSVPPRSRGSVEGDISALEQVLKDGHITFNAVARAWFHLCDDSLSDAHRERCESLFPALLSAFSEPRGGIITAYFCKHLQIAAVLTDIHTAAKLGESPPVAGQDGPPEPPARTGRALDRWRAAHDDRIGASNSAIHVECAMGDPVDPVAREILFRCLNTHYRAIEFLQPKPRKVCMRLLMNVVTSLLGSLDERKANGRRSFGTDAEEIASLNGLLDQACHYYERSAHRQAQVEYFLGMGQGIVLLGGFFAAMALLWHQRLDADPLVYTPIAGALGAFVSVLARMTRGQLVLTYESGKTIMRLLGGIRPLLGALFGAAVFVLLESKMLGISAPEPASDFYFVGIAFLAGFSERFAQDMIAKAPGAEAASQPPAAPAAAVAPQPPAS
ncbi:MAG: hypothetical protein QOK16_1495 [Solirubrobacteraceae bacterium]|jgi:hypothetical protein|nr:hypothetical protein [Solirubrobacteraceae bacterium]